MKSLIRTAQVAAISLSIFGSGANLALSFILIPRLLESPTPLMVRQWLRTYSRTKLFFPATLHPAAAAFYFLAWQHRTVAVQMKLYLAAGLLLSSIGPYTLAAMAPVNQKLIEKVEETLEMTLDEEAIEVSVEKEASAKWLVDQWGLLNLPRGVAMGLAGLLGFLATTTV